MSEMSAGNRCQQIKTLEECIRGLKQGTLNDKRRANSLRQIANCWDPKQPIQPTQDQLKKAWKHLTHEVQALNQQGSEYLRLNELKHGGRGRPRPTEKTGMPPQRVINALLDAFYLHARALDEFLYSSSRGDKDTMFAEDFVPGWPCSRPESLLRKEELKPLIGKVSPSHEINQSRPEPPPQNEALKPPMGKVSLRDEINKMIVHLCYRRVDMYDVMCDLELVDRWPVEQTMKDMCVPLKAFAKSQSVASNLDAEDFREQVEKLCEAVRKLSKTHP